MDAKSGIIHEEDYASPSPKPILSMLAGAFASRPMRHRFASKAGDQSLA